MRRYRAHVALLIAGLLLGSIVSAPAAPTVKGGSSSFFPGTFTANRICLDATNKDTGLSRSSAGVVKLDDCSTGSGSIMAGDGTAAAPGYRFSTTGIGVIRDGSGCLALAVTSAARFTVCQATATGASGTIITAQNTFASSGFSFANIASNMTADGQFAYCVDCKVTTGTPGNPSTISNNTCTSGGNGALVVRLNGVNVCVQ